MAHYAFLDENNIVVQVIVGIDEDDISTLPEQYSSWEHWYEVAKNMPCKRTSYNTIYGEHVLGGTPFRGNYAGIGMVYDSINDVFRPQRPYPSWTLNTDKWIWEAPVPMPEMSEEDMDAGKYYEWNESTQTWELLTPTE